MKKKIILHYVILCLNNEIDILLNNLEKLSDQLNSYSQKVTKQEINLILDKNNHRGKKKRTKTKPQIMIIFEWITKLCKTIKYNLIQN